MTQPRRLVFVLGGKGGTGKTLFCRTLYYHLLSSGISTLGFDGDIENPEFSWYHKKTAHPVTKLDFLESEGAKGLFTQIREHNPQVVVFDMPGASGEATREQFTYFDAFHNAQENGYRITLSTVINNTFPPISSLRAMIDFCDAQVDYLVVKSKFWAQHKLDFQRWQDSETREAFLARKGIEIEMPLFDVTTFDVFHGKNLSFFDVDQIPYGDQLLVRSFLKFARAEFDQASAYLGLPEPPEKKPTERVKIISQKKAG